MSDIMEFFAPCAAGLEPVLAGELKHIGIRKTRPLTGGVAFYGDLEDAYRACLWSRTASRVLMLLDRFPTQDARELYEGARLIRWEDHFGPERSIYVHASGTTDELRDTRFSALTVKDAVCDRLREICGARPNVDRDAADVRISVALRRGNASVFLNLSGEPLHRRGYRMDGRQAEAPIKENLAAGLLLAAGWRERARAGESFCDPLCGSGTFAIEAAAIAADQAPGLLRDRWGFDAWRGHDEELWARLIDEADDAFERGLEHVPAIFGSDRDAEAVVLARDNARRAGLGGKISFAVGDVADLAELLPADVREGAGLVATNPPYGERLSSDAQLSALYAAMDEGLGSLSDAWTFAAISPDPALGEGLGRAATSELVTYNGPHKARFCTYGPKVRAAHEVEVVDLKGEVRKLAVENADAQDFANRLRKSARHLGKHARRNDIFCWRVYDADLPEFSAAIDVYDCLEPEGRHGRAGDHVAESEPATAFAHRSIHIAEYQAPREIDPAKAASRMRDLVKVAAAVFALDADDVFVKTRRQAKGGSQYGREGASSVMRVTREAGFDVEVDLAGYLDTGIFLDHRITRAALEPLAEGKHFLNLFSYTCTASLYAARGGAASVTNVDLSNTYLDRGEDNARRNGLDGVRTLYERRDCVEWVAEERRGRNRYGLIFVDPPTFSNSKSMGRSTWSVQRDHAELLIGVSRLLARDGVAVFSCNLRGFKPETDKLQRCGVAIREVGADSVPFDFARNPKIHRTYLVARTGSEHVFERPLEVFARLWKDQRL